MSWSQSVLSGLEVVVCPFDRLDVMKLRPSLASGWISILM